MNIGSVEASNQLMWFHRLAAGSGPCDRARNGWLAMGRQALALLALLMGCGLHGAESVRKVDFHKTPQLESLAARARQVGNEMYPRVVALLGEEGGKSPGQFDIVFKKRLGEDIGGKVIGRTIYLNGEWLAKSPVDLDVILIHEMAHVAQYYSWFRRLRNPVYWTEGLATYVPYKFGYGEGRFCAKCAASYPHYKSGYWCTGAFLMFIDETHGTEVIRQLNAALRRGSYDDDFFEHATGRSLEMLWTEFQKTPAFTPLAAIANQLNQKLGYVNGKAPWCLRSHFETYLKQQTGTNLTNVQKSLGYARNKAPKNAPARYASYLYSRQPAGMLTSEAAKMLGELGKKGALPGWKKEMIFEGVVDGFSTNYPVERSFTGRIPGEMALYHYRMGKESKGADWKLKRAWRSGPDARVLEEYSLSRE